jgi:hypothetical protein
VTSAAAADISEADCIFPACSSLIRITPLGCPTKVEHDETIGQQKTESPKKQINYRLLL